MSAPTIAGITAEQFDAALKEGCDATRAKWYMPKDITPSERLKILKRDAEASQKINILRDVARLGFAEERGWLYWKYSARHVDEFLDPKTKRVVARVFHGFEPFKKKPLGVDLPFSWRHGLHSHSSPGKGFAVLVTELV